jgi:hypothetical protein
MKLDTQDKMETEKKNGKALENGKERSTLIWLLGDALLWQIPFPKIKTCRAERCRYFSESIRNVALRPRVSGWTSFGVSAVNLVP